MKDIKEKVLAEWGLINRLAVKRFGETVLAEEAALSVMDGLQADDWRRVRAYNGKASFSTFVGALSIRLVEDFSRKRFGRVRPPAWLSHLGVMWRKLFSALCLERLSPGDAVETVHQGETGITKQEVEDAAYEILGRIPHCGAAQGLETVFDGDEQGPAESPVGKADLTAEKSQGRMIFAVLFTIITGGDRPEPSREMLERFESLNIVLRAEERLLLKLCFQDNYGVAAAGKMLGWNRFQSHGRMRRLMTRLRDELDRTGLAEELRLLLTG